MPSARLTDAFPTTISITGITGALFYEKSVTPPGYDIGGFIDITGMRNIAWRTRMPRKLKTGDDIAITAAWNPGVYAQMVTNLGVNGQATITLPDGTTIAVWGFLTRFKPGTHTEGTEPTADLTFVLSNLNATMVETGPVVTLPP